MSDEPIDREQLPVAPQTIRTAVLRELTTLTGAIAEIPLDRWNEASAASGWSMGDVVVHLNLTLGLYSRLLDAALAGRGGSGAWRAFGQISKKMAPVVAPAFNALNSKVPQLLGNALAPEVIKGQFAASARAVRARVERVGPEDYARPIHYMGGPWPLSFFLAAMENELALHGWDMMSRLQPEATLSAEARAVLPAFYWGATSYMFHPPPAVRGAIQCDLDSPVFTAWWMMNGGPVRQGLGEVRMSDCTIRGNSGTAVLVLAGRVSPAEVMRGGSLSVTGNEELALGFLGAWRIV